MTRPWIVPNEIIVKETKDSSYIYKATLKVMLEQDFLKGSAMYSFKDDRAKALNEYSSQLIRELIIPKLTKEVNISKRYSALRQVYYSLIFSRWFKARFASQKGKYASLIDRRNLTGLTSTAAWSKTFYFNAYKKSFAQGEYSLKETVRTPTGQVIRSYFSGGADFKFSTNAFNGGMASSSVSNTFISAALKAGLEAPEGMDVEVRTTSSPIQWRKLTDQEVPASFANVLGDFGIQEKEIQVVRLKGNLPPEEILKEPRTRAIIETSIGQALGSSLFKGVGTKEGKSVADANAVEFSRRSIVYFTIANPKEAVVIMADEGERDESVSLKRGRIYWGGYSKDYWDPDKDNFLNSLETEVNRLRHLGVSINYFAGDALEHTNGLIIKEAITQSTNSWSIASLFNDFPGETRRTVWDKFRIAGVSFHAPNDAGVEPLDLPSIATRKIAVVLAQEKRTIDPDLDFAKYYADFMNHLAILTLGSRDKDLAKEPTQSGDSRHLKIIEDVKELQKLYPGLKLLTPGDGDFAPRAVASLGLDVGGGYKMMVFGRSGSTEATVAKLVASLVANGQFSSRFLSEKMTAKDVSAETANSFTEQDMEMFAQLGYDGHAHLRMHNSKDFQGSGVFALTAVTGASEKFFGKELSELLQRVTFDGHNGIVTTNTLSVTPDGSVFVIRTNLQSGDLFDTQNRIMRASPEAIQFLNSQAGNEFLDKQASSLVGKTTADSAIGKPAVGGNWKLRPFKDEAEARAKAREFREGLAPIGDKATITIYVDRWMKPIADEWKGSNIQVGVQSFRFDYYGTGSDEVIRQDIEEAVRNGAKFAMIGHSMHRKPDEKILKALPGLVPLDDARANKIVKNILADGRLGLQYIVAVDEYLDDAGNPYPITLPKQAEYIRSQIYDGVNIGLADISPEQLSRMVITVEPMRDISTKSGDGAIDLSTKVNLPKVDMLTRYLAETLHKKFGDVAKSLNIGYGASAGPDTAEFLLSQNNVHNILPGGKSLEVADFLPTIENAIIGFNTKQAVASSVIDKVDSTEAQILRTTSRSPEDQRAAYEALREQGYSTEAAGEKVGEAVKALGASSAVVKVHGDKKGRLRRMIFSVSQILYRPRFRPVADLENVILDILSRQDYLTKYEVKKGKLSIKNEPLEKTIFLDPFRAEDLYLQLDDIKPGIVKGRVVLYEYGYVGNDKRSRIVADVDVLVESAASSAVDDRKGGIDFTSKAMLINYQPMGNFAMLKPKLPVLSRAELAVFNIDQELSAMERLVDSQMIPSGERLKEVLAACSQKGELTANKERLTALLVKIGIVEETQCCLQEASNSYKEALVLADSLA